MNIDEQVTYLRKGLVDLIREEDLRAKLERSAKTGKPLFSFPAHQKGLLFAEFSPDGNRLATSSMDHTAQVWEIDWEGGMLKPIGQRLRHRNWVYSVAFSPDGRSVVTASFDRTAQVWDAATGSAAGLKLTIKTAADPGATPPFGA